MLILFWISIFIVFYSYVGYAILLFILVKIKRIFGSKAIKQEWKDNFTVSFVVAAYNEKDYIEEKLQNCSLFDYPLDKIEFVFVTDGSDDGTPDLINQLRSSYNQMNIKVYHESIRAGKIAAVERIMPFLTNDIIIFTDANTDINSEGIKRIVRHYNDTNVGGVAGEKRIAQKDKDMAAGAGEGFYWKYESLLKKWDSELSTVVGAAGELFSIRRALYHPVAKDTLIEDFVTTMQLVQQGYKVIYEPDAYAVEGPSATIEDELKRKIRISAGGLQAVYRLSSLLNIFKYGLPSFQYISHRVLRWTLAPLALPIIFITNIFLLSESIIYKIVFICQILFYFAAILGYVLENRKIKFKIFFIPYYFSMMNYSVYAGLIRLIKKSQSVVWEKANRA
jgi:poly-beta-1,6-N-acetyl-D-glucosamine synthase